MPESLTCKEVLAPEIRDALETVREHLCRAGFATFQKPSLEKEPFSYGHYFQTIPENVKDLWFGFVKDKEHSGLYLRARPKSENSTRRLMHEGYKYTALWSPQFWLVKRFVSNKGLDKLLRLAGQARKQYLNCIIENTYPF